jgi:hypothetical protein
MSAPANLTAWTARGTGSRNTPGRTLAGLEAMDRPGNEADRFHLVLKDLASGHVSTLAGDWDRSIDQYDFA